MFPSTSPNDLRVTVYDPLRGAPVAELEERRRSYAMGKHACSRQALGLRSLRPLGKRKANLHLLSPPLLPARAFPASEVVESFKPPKGL